MTDRLRLAAATFVTSAGCGRRIARLVTQSTAVTASLIPDRCREQVSTQYRHQVFNRLLLIAWKSDSGFSFLHLLHFIVKPRIFYKFVCFLNVIAAIQSRPIKVVQIVAHGDRDAFFNRLWALVVREFF